MLMLAVNDLLPTRMEEGGDGLLRLTFRFQVTGGGTAVPGWEWRDVIVHRVGSVDRDSGALWPPVDAGIPSELERWIRTLAAAVIESELVTMQQVLMNG